MLSASDDVLNQFNCTDSSGEDVGNSPTNQKFAHPSLEKIHITLLHNPTPQIPSAKLLVSPIGGSSPDH